MRREWIEMVIFLARPLRMSTSPSMRREWIEISVFFFLALVGVVSPSMRREWIEMIDTKHCVEDTECLPPCGGSGLK